LKVWQNVYNWEIRSRNPKIITNAIKSKVGYAVKTHSKE
jgi:hypothetical protein